MFRLRLATKNFGLCPPKKSLVLGLGRLCKEKNGYAKLYDDNNTFMTNEDNCDTTYTDKHMRNM